MYTLKINMYGSICFKLNSKESSTFETIISTNEWIFIIFLNNYFFRLQFYSSIKQFMRRYFIFKWLYAIIYLS